MGIGKHVPIIAFVIIASAPQLNPFTKKYRYKIYITELYL